MTTWQILVGDVRERLQELPDASVQCCVTSPPYWSLRDYGVPPSVWAGNPRCAHEWQSAGKKEGYTSKRKWQHSENGRGEEQPSDKTLRDPVTRETSPEAWNRIEQGRFCPWCGAWIGALGLEPTPDLFVAHTVEVFREVRRVLKEDGTLWLNIGDSYQAAKGQAGGNDPKQPAPPSRSEAERQEHRGLETEGSRRHPVVARVRAQGGRLVSALRNHLARERIGAVAPLLASEVA